MRRAIRGLGLLCAPLLMLAGPANAQGAEPPSGEAAPPSSPPAQPFDPSVPPFPLRPGERLIPTKTPGCAVLIKAATPNDLAAWPERRWQGGCRFGLVHGTGYLTSANGNAERWTFIYGQFAQSTQVSGHTLSAKSSYKGGEAYERYSLKRAGSLDSFDFGDELAFDTVAADGSFERQWFSVGRYACQFKGLPETVIPINQGKYEKDARSVCYKGLAGYGGNPAVYPDSKYIALWRNRYDTNGNEIPGTRSLEVAICTVTKDLDYNQRWKPPCNPAFNRLIAPIRQRILDMHAAKTANIAAADADAKARGEPYEAQLKAWVRDFARR